MKRKRTNGSVAFYLTLFPGLVLGLALAALAAFGVNRYFNDDQLPSFRSHRVTESELPVVTRETLVAAKTTAASTIANTTAIQTTASTTPAPTREAGIPDPAWTVASPVYEGYDPLESDSSRIVPAMLRVEPDYFDDALFVGNSIIGLQMLTGSIENATYYTRHSLQVESFFTQEVLMEDGSSQIIPDALDQRQFGKVYLMLGLNEMSWPNFDLVVDRFEDVMLTIMEKQPEAIFYVESVLPVEATLDVDNYIPNNELAQLMNEAILGLCEKHEVWFLNVAEAFYDADGKLPVDSSHDGVHFNPAMVAIWDEYLYTHAFPEKP